jgi:hypothetical protein
MLRQKNIAYYVAAAVVTGLLTQSVPAFAIEKLVRGASPAVGMQPAQAMPQAEGPLTVMQVQVDKTSDNAVLARDEAIAEARRIAFQKLAERNMTPEEFQSFKMPDAKTIAALVQDFEIAGEQLSANRYVATFTVRFRERVRNYVNVDMTKLPPDVEMANNMAAAQSAAVEPEVPADAVDEVAAEDSAIAATTVTTTTTTTDATPQKPRKMVVLPYFEGIDGKTVLWEENNPWRDMWQKDAPKAPVGGNQFFVPLGDISDVAAGPAAAVWSGDYRAVEKLRVNYAADDVVLAVANRSGPYLTLDMYFFRDGKLQGREVLQPYVGDIDQQAALKKGMDEVIRFMQRPVSANKIAREDTVQDISRTLVSARDLVVAQDAAVAQAAPQQQPAAAPVTGGATSVDASLSFTQFATWMDFQKRVAGLSPPVGVDIRSLSKNNAQFTLRYSAGVAALQSALAARGVMLQAPAVTVDPSVIGLSGGGAVYSIQLLN